MARGPTLAVVDASVVVKWFKDEDHTERAIALRDDWVRGRAALHTVELMPYEVLNALRYNPDQTAESLRRAAVNLCDYPFSFMPIADIAEMTIENALRYGISVYDACPSRAVFLEFSGGRIFADACAAAGLPVPTVRPLGDVYAALHHDGTTASARGRMLGFDALNALLGLEELYRREREWLRRD